jgi:hypothetical protein
MALPRRSVSPRDRVGVLRVPGTFKGVGNSPVGGPTRFLPRHISMGRYDEIVAGVVSRTRPLVVLGHAADAQSTKGHLQGEDMPPLSPRRGRQA